MLQVTLRRAGAEDVEHVKWALYTALVWNPDRELPPIDVTLEHDEAARYHRDWGRPGDLGIVAAADGGVVGVAYSRLFTHDDHGHGYLDDETPEVAVAVREDYGGRGLGGWLLNELAQAAEAEGFTRLSLSVAADNPARRLYERLGYEEVSADESGLRMALELGRRV